MTLTQDAPTHWTDIEPLHVRNPLLAEMAEASVAAIRDTDPMRQAFFTGLFTGYAVGFGLVTREALDRARREPFSANTHIDVWRPHAHADTDSAWASGVRHGYYLSTSERDDAQECVLCGERLIEGLDDTEWCGDGWFCELDGHSADWHANGQSLCRMDGE